MRILFPLLATLVLATSALAFQTPGAPATVEEALATPTDLQFGDAKPADVSEWLAKRYRINVFVDQRALADRERAEVRLRGSAKAETLAEGLTKLLQPHKMKWKLEHDVLWLTAEDDFDWVTHVYRAADAASAKAWCARLPREYAPWPENARVLSYDRAVVVTHTSVDHFHFRRKFKDALPRADADGVSLLPAKLVTRRDVEFSDAKVKDVAAWLAKETGLTVRVAEDAFEQARIPVDTRLTARLRNVRLADALDLLLKDHQLSWQLGIDTLVITTLEQADSERSLSVVDVRGLMASVDVDEIDDFISTAVSPELLPEGTGPSRNRYAHPGFMVVELPFRGHRELAMAMEELRWALRKE